MKKNANFNWTSECQGAFEKLKTKLTQSPILIHPNYNDPFILETDASGFGLGAILTQVRDGKEHPIAYASRSLKPAEKNYPVFELEALAVVWAVKQFRSYLFQQKVTIVTDHAALQYILTKANPSARIARWGLALQEYQLEIKHRPGKNHGNVDALSRIYCQRLVANSKPPETLPKNQSDILKTKQANDDFCSPIINYLTRHEVPDGKVEAQRITALSTQFVMSNNLLYYIGPPHKSTKSQLLVVPTEMKEEIMQAHHDDVFAGHFGFLRTCNRIKEKYYWQELFILMSKIIVFSVKVVPLERRHLC